MVKLIAKRLNEILILVLVTIVIVQGVNIKDLQKKADYLFEEVYFLGGAVGLIDLELREHIEKGGADR